MEFAENESVGLGVRVARKTGGACVGGGVFCLVVGPEAFETPAAGGLIEARVFDHHVYSAAVAFEDDAALLLSFAQFVHDDRAVREFARRVTVGSLGIREDVVHSLFALGECSAGQDDSGADVYPAAKAVGVLGGFGGAQEADGQRDKHQGERYPSWNAEKSRVRIAGAFCHGRILPRGRTCCIVKNSTSRGDDERRADCIASLSAVLERRYAGEPPKIVDEMRLVEVTAVCGEPRPIHGQSLFDAT